MMKDGSTILHFKENGPLDFHFGESLASEFCRASNIINKFRSEVFS
jgi:hypothetical protein